MFIINTFSTCFGHHYAHLQENKTCVTACSVLRWYCWMCLATVPAQHTTCSNTRLGLLKMAIMMPETCWECVDNKNLTVASCWFSLSLHNLFTMHRHRNLKPTSYHFDNYSVININIFWHIPTYATFPSVTSWAPPPKNVVFCRLSGSEGWVKK